MNLQFRAHSTYRRLHHTGVTALLLLAGLAVAPRADALLPPAEVECCQRKDYQSAQCARFTLSAARCEQVVSNWNEVFQRFSAMRNPPVATKAAPAEVALLPLRIEARLFYHHSGTFSDLIDGTAVLRNVTTADSAALEPATVLGLDVVVSGPENANAAKRQVTIEVVHTRTGKKISQQSGEVGVLSAAGIYHVPFLLQGVGCEPLSITAQVTGSTVTRSLAIPFQCGE